MEGAEGGPERARGDADPAAPAARRLGRHGTQEIFSLLNRPFEWGMHQKGRDLRGGPEAVRQAVGGGCQSGWGRLLSVTNAIEAGTWRQGDSGWA